MRRRMVLAGIVLVTVGPATKATDETPRHALTAESYERLRDFIVPSDDELAWREIAWRPTFAAAVREAAATDRPILLWAMNGHPLGCT